jgi:chaperone LolA
MNVLGLFILTVLAGSTADAWQREQTVRDIVDRMQRRYDTMTDAVADYTQHVKFGYSQVEQTFRGTLTLKKPRKYRIESEHQTLVTDGATVWAYSPLNKQVLIDRFKENQNTLTPDHFLLSLPANYNAALLGKETIEGASTFALRLVPKDEQSFIKSMKVWVEEGTWIVRRVLVVDVNETETTYTVANVRLNTNVKDELFSFSAPPGIEVVDLR